MPDEAMAAVTTIAVSDSDSTSASLPPRVTEATAALPPRSEVPWMVTTWKPGPTAGETLVMLPSNR